MPPDEPTEEEKLQELPQDSQTPFQPADPSRDGAVPVDSPSQSNGQLDDTHPATDTNLEQEELYDEGVSGVAEARDPKDDSDVTGYNEPGQNIGSPS